MAHGLRQKAHMNYQPTVAMAPYYLPQQQTSHTRSLEPGSSLRLLTFNMQVGINTQRYHHYLTRSWQHVLPHQHRDSHLDYMSEVLKGFDIVALQEADGGSLRTRYINQVEYLAKQASFPYWYQQVNRNLGKFAQHSNGLLSRTKPMDIEDHSLPGFIPGRGAITVRYQVGGQHLLLVVLHLSLGQRCRNKQLDYIRGLIADDEHVVIMGDMNTQVEKMLSHRGLDSLNLVPCNVEPTFPSWRPIKCLDHILVSPQIKVNEAQVLDSLVSDHLPIAVNITLPFSN